MKTKNNVQKTVLRSGAVVISFVLISFTVSAQDFWKRLLENSRFNDIAIALVDSPVATGIHEVTAESIAEADFETKVEAEVEPGSRVMCRELFQIEQDGEASLELKPWMMSEKAWGN